MSDHRSRGAIARLAGGAFLLTVAGLAVSYLTNIYLARSMGPSAYGGYAFAVSWAVLLAVPTTLGLPATLLRLLPGFEARQDPPHYRGLLRFSWAIVAIASVAAAVVAGLIGLAAGASRAVALALVAIPFLALTDLQGAAARTLGDVFWATAPKGLLRFGGIGLLVAVLRAFGGSLDAGGGALLFVAVTATIALLQLVWLLTRLGARRVRGPSRVRPGPWLRIALPLLVTTAIATVFARTDTLMLGLFDENSAVALYFAAARLAALVSFSLTATNTVGAPLLSRSDATGDRAQLARTARTMTQLAFWPALLIASTLALAGPTFLGLFGAAFRAANAFLPILLAGQLLNVIVGPVALLLNMTGHQRVTALAGVVAATANVALNLVLIPRYGPTGAALATTITMGSWNAALAMVVWRRLKVNTTVFSRFWKTP